ncbi:hypothetical protein TKK_0005683 [Trichogramma kaykai]
MSLPEQLSIKGLDGHDVLINYQIISNKLKKRFLRKPNVAEASEQFDALAISCEQKDLHHYAGCCWLAAARCQGTIGNSITEINLLIRAGRQFLLSNKKSNDIGCLSISQEDHQAAINTFNHTLTRCETKEHFGVMAAGLAIELATALGANTEGIEYLYKSVHAHSTVKAINMLVSYYIKQGNYVSALHVLNELVEMIENHTGSKCTGYYRDILHNCEINKVLLLLILRPSPQRLAPSLAQVLEKYAWAEDNTPTVSTMQEDKMILLQSLVLACQSRNYESLLELENELWSFFNTEQKELLQKLIRTYRKD